MQMTSLGLPDLRSGVATSLKESSDFLSRWLVGGGGPFVDTEEEERSDFNDSLRPEI